MLILRRRDVHAVLDGDDAQVCQVIRDTYVAHARGQTAVPHSLFLRFPDDPKNRIIALPAYVGGARPVAGVKWIASFPDNIARGVARASAAIVLNSLEDGTPVAMIEGALISARRTAASAAVAAAELTRGAPPQAREAVTLVGCGVINDETLRMLRLQLPELARVTLFDLDPDRAREFADRVGQRWPDLAVEVAPDIDRALAANRLVSLATTAVTPYLTTASCQPGTVLLHLSLRDITPDSVLSARNIVDDVDHVMRAGTSLELAEQMSGKRDFVRAQLGDLLDGRTRLAYEPRTVTVFSPFGLGALDAALAAYVLDVATARGLGVDVPDFGAETGLHASATAS